MGNIDSIWGMLKFDSEAVSQFFIVFSRFEYALKRAGYIKNAKGFLQIDWDRFGEEHANEFNPSKNNKLKKAVVYLRKNPPKKQYYEGGKLIWKQSTLSEKKPELQTLLSCIRTARNNLFHGGKFPGMPIKDPARDSNLLNSSLVILDEVLDLDSKVKSNFLSENE